MGTWTRIWRTMPTSRRPPRQTLLLPQRVREQLDLQESRSMMDAVAVIELEISAWSMVLISPVACLSNYCMIKRFHFIDHYRPKHGRNLTACIFARSFVTWL